MTRLVAFEADLLIHEATFLDEEADRAAETHSTARQAAELAAAAVRDDAGAHAHLAPATAARRGARGGPGGVRQHHRPRLRWRRDPVPGAREPSWSSRQSRNSSSSASVSAGPFQEEQVAGAALLRPGAQLADGGRRAAGLDVAQQRLGAIGRPAVASRRGPLPARDSVAASVVPGQVLAEQQGVRGLANDLLLRGCGAASGPSARTAFISRPLCLCAWEFIGQARVAARAVERWRCSASPLLGQQRQAGPRGATPARAGRPAGCCEQQQDDAAGMAAFISEK